MGAWARTSDGWAVNLDGTDASRAFTLPRIELHSGARGWTAVCHLEGGSSRTLAIGSASSAIEAQRTAVERALAVIGDAHAAALRALL
jgi:hypothetical protein